MEGLLVIFDLVNFGPAQAQQPKNSHHNHRLQKIPIENIKCQKYIKR
jgi:hypothetical protein